MLPRMYGKEFSWMKKLVSLYLALCLLLSVAPALAEALPELEDAAALPRVGDVVHGFEAQEIRDFSLVGATAVLFEHQQTGAKLLYIANDDTNRAFDLTFLTRPIDNTGLPHVFEHSTLDGSEKYPSKLLFMNLMYQTYNTFMNAYTASALTGYPVSSLSEAQLLKYADFYTDSCLHPMVLQDESIYKEEAWRYRMASMEDELTLEGTVYSEMLGATTLQRRAAFNAYRAAFPGSVVGLDQGGQPEDIPNMTWESLKAYHEKFYHPSNSIAFLYGQFEDYTAFLSLLNDAYAPYERAEFAFEDSGYTPLTEPVEAVLPFPMAAGSNTDHASMVYYYVVCPGLKADPQEEMIVNTLTDLLVSPSSLLMQNLRKALPTGQFATAIEINGPEDAVVFVAMNVDEEDGKLFKETVDASLREIAEKGFAQEMVDGVMASLALSIKLAPESSDPCDDLLPSIASYYATSGDPFEYMDYVDALGKIDDWNQLGLYTKAIRSWLLDSERTALVTTYPQPGQKEINDAALAQKLADIKAQMTEEEKQAIIDFTNASDPEEDTTAMVNALTAVTVESLPEEIKEYQVTDAVGDDGIRRADAVAAVDGIGKTVLFLDAQGLPQESLHWFKLFTELLGEMDTDAHTKEELDVLISRYLYGVETRLSLMGTKEEYHPYLRLGWIAMDADLEKGYELMYELVYATRFDDIQKLTERVQNLKASLKSTINSSSYNILLYRAFAVTNPLYRYYSYFNYLEYYDFLVQVEKALTDEPEAVTAALQAIQAYFHNNTNAISAFAGNTESIELNRGLADAFLAKLDHHPVEAAVYDLPVPASREALIVENNVQFNGIVADYDALDMPEYDAALDAISALIGDVYLIPQLRDQYGVYTPLTGAISDGGVYLLTYRDPNVRQTFQVYDALPDALAKMDVSQNTLNGYIASSYAVYAKGSGELNGALEALVSVLDHRDPAEALLRMRQLKAVTPERVAASADMYHAMMEKGVRCTAGSAAAINANADLYDVILNPFNAQDSSNVEFSDVPQGSEAYDAVHLVFEETMMDPVSETVFGVDENATVGDLAGALYVLAQGPAHEPVEATAFLAEYGIVPPDATAETVLTHGLSDSIFVSFGAAVGLPLQADAPSETTAQPMTRGELAQQLQLFLETLEAIQ